MWPCIVTCDRASWHVTVHHDMWPCIMTCDRTSLHVTVHHDMWPCIVTCDRASWHVTVHHDKFPYNKPTRCTNFSILFWKWNSTYFGQFLCPSSGWPSWSCSKAVYKPVWHILLLNVQWITPDDGQRNCPKHVEFHFQNKFWEISASSWFIIRKEYTNCTYWKREPHFIHNTVTISALLYNTCKL
jgi:hypothetical protein